jgi:sulfite exporter TauE/SafE
MAVAPITFGSRVVWRGLSGTKQSWKSAALPGMVQQTLPCAVVYAGPRIAGRLVL